MAKWKFSWRALVDSQRGMGPKDSHVSGGRDMRIISSGLGNKQYTIVHHKDVTLDDIIKGLQDGKFKQF